MELAAFAERYAAALEALDAVDGPGLLARAERAVIETPPAYQHVLVDDGETSTAASGRLLFALAAEAMSLCVAANPDATIGSRRGEGPQVFEDLEPEITLTEPFRRPSQRALVRCNHPSIEPEVIAA